MIQRTVLTGALVVAGRAEEEYSTEDQQLLFALARQGAAALQNALAQEHADNFFTHVSKLTFLFVTSPSV